MRCPRCGSEAMVKIGAITYCRHCIAYGQIRKETMWKALPEAPIPNDIHLELGYELSPKQKELSEDVIHAIDLKRNVVIEAVCGSGKTEICYPAMIEVLRRGGRVGFALPRQQLAIEIFERFKSQLKNIGMCLVYGGHHDSLDEPLVVLTTHQLFRYHHYFDLLIIDEIDAFPFRDDTLLHEMAIQSIKGSMVLLSATLMDVQIPGDFIYLSLHQRYHKHPLPVPKLKRMPTILSIIYLYVKVKRALERGALPLVYTPTMKDCKTLKLFFSLLHVQCDVVYAQLGTKVIQERIQRFKKRQMDLLISTTLLERGVTFENVYVYVYKANHLVFNTATLIQIAGRVGRKPNHPDGEVIFVANRPTNSMKACKAQILQSNIA